MAIKPYVCRQHGATAAYTHVRLSGRNKGDLIRVCRQCRAAQVKRTWQRIKLQVIAAYGERCSCCGEREPRFLTIDHIHGNGREHRATVGRGHHLYEWLKRQGFPKEDYRLLCFNCNCARGQYGTCPHES